MISRTLIPSYLFQRYLRTTKMFLKKPNHRIFDYQPRFYNPQMDESEKRKRRLGFTRQRKFRGRKRSPVIWLVFILAVIYLFFKFGGSF
jgi:hypothetical protein